jgi:transcriptional regulator with XRE-family HTH domain
LKPAALREARRRLGLTQAQLASVLGLTREAVNRYESGSLRITPVLEFAMQHLVERAGPALKSPSSKRTRPAE